MLNTKMPRRISKGVYGARSRRRTYRKKFNPRWRKKQRFTVAKSLGYKGFHCFKEAASGSLTITGTPGSPNSETVQEIKINGETYPTWRFNLNQINDIRNYKNLFQQARLTGVQIKIFPSHNASSYLTNSTILDAAGDPAGTSTSTFRPIPSLVYKFDPNDHTNPSSFENLLEKDPRFVYLNGTYPRKIYIKPRLRMVQAEGLLLTDSILANTKCAKWINLDKLEDAPSSTYDYAGLDMGSMGCHGTVTMPIVLTYYFQCKTPT